MNWNVKRFSMWNISQVILMRSGSNLCRKELTVHWSAHNSLIRAYLQPCTNSMWGDESEAVAPIIWLFQIVDAQKEEVFFPELLITVRSYGCVKSSPQHRNQGNAKDRIQNITWTKKWNPPHGKSLRISHLLNVKSMADGNMLHTSIMPEWHQKTYYGIVLNKMVSNTRFNPEWRDKWIIRPYIACVRLVKSWGNTSLE